MAYNYRERILHVKDFFEKYTDEHDKKPMSAIVEYLKKKHIESDPRNIEQDIHVLQNYGMYITEDETGRNRWLVEREFDVAEVKLIIDWIASSKFLPEKRSKELIEKLKRLVSVYQANQIERQIRINGDLKSKNIAAFYHYNTINEAMTEFQDIEFQYYQYNMEKKLELKEDGKTYYVKPIRLFYDNDYCYLQALEDEEIKTFRVDKMTNVQMVDDSYHKRLTLSRTRNLFHRARNGTLIECKKEKEIQIILKKDMMDAVIDKFGDDINVEIINDDSFRLRVKTTPDHQFFSWIFELGENAMIEYPLDVAAQMMDLLKERYKAYREGHSRNIYYYRRKTKKSESSDSAN